MIDSFLSISTINFGLCGRCWRGPPLLSRPGQTDVIQLCRETSQHWEKKGRRRLKGLTGQDYWTETTLGEERTQLVWGHDRKQISCVRGTFILLQYDECTRHGFNLWLRPLIVRDGNNELSQTRCGAPHCSGWLSTSCRGFVRRGWELQSNVKMDYYYRDILTHKLQPHY